jgi:citrate lyase gamma subunit
VHMKVTGTAVGASGENEGFAELARTTIADVAPAARPEISVAGDDQVTIELDLDRSDQSQVGEAMEQLLTEAVVYSELIDEGTG